MTVSCFYCTATPEDYEALARHIASAKKGHRKGKRWAAGYLLKTRKLNKKREFNPTPLTEEDRENKKSVIRELSGENEYILTVCPHCKKGNRVLLPNEFIHSEQAWRTLKGTLIVNCEGCK